MATIPVVDGPRVQSRPLPAPQLSGVSPDALGAGFGEALQGTGNLLARAAAEERDKADAARLTSTSLQLDQLEHQLMFDPDHGALVAKGLDTIPVYDQTLKAYDVATSAMEAGLANDRQKQAFSQMRAQRRASIGGAIESHTRSEVDRADAENTQAAVESAASLGVTYYTDPMRLGKEMARGVALIQSYAARSGMGAEARDQKVADFVSGLHAGVIERALSNDQAGFAKTYLDAHRKEIAGDKIARLEEAVNQGTTLQQAFAESDRITAAAPDRASALAMVREIKDPEVRQRAQAEVNQVYSEREQAQREAENHLFENGSRMLESDRTGNINRLKQKMGADWLRLDQNSRVALEGRAKQIADLARGIPPVTDSRVFTEFLLKTPAEQAKVDPLRDLRHSLSDGDYEQAVRQVAAARQYMATGKDASGQVGEGLGFKERVVTGAEAAGIVPVGETSSKWSTEQKSAFNAFLSRAETALEEAQQAKGGKLTVKEKQEVMDRLTIKVSLDRRFLRDTEVPGLTIPEDDIDRAYIPIAQIGDAGKESIIRTILNAGGAVTERKQERIAAILALSAVGRLTDDAARERILAVATEKVDE